jgi:hypothetical protein
MSLRLFLLGIIPVTFGLASASMVQAQLLQPQTPTVEQRLGASIAALVVENARLASELETARQTIEKLKEDLARKNQSETK